MSRQDRSSTSSEAAADEIDLLTLFRTFWRGRLMIGSAVVAAILLGGIYAFVLATPTFRATSVVVLETRQSATTGLESVLGALSSDSETINTEVEVLKGRELMGRVVDELNLIQDGEFNGSLRPKGLISRIKSSIFGEDEQTAEEAQRIKDGVVSALLDGIQIRNVPNSLVFQITVTSTSPVKAAKIADTVAKLYINDQLRVRFEANEVATRWLSDQVAEQRAAFESLDEQVRDFRAQTSVINGETLAAMDRQLKDTRRRIEQMTSESGELNIRIAGLPADAPTSRRMQLTNDLSRMQEQIAALTEVERTLAADFDRQSQELTRLEQLAREAEAGRLLYEHFQTRLKEVAAQQGINKADSRVLSQAVIPSGAAAPRKSMILVMSALLGAMAGAGLVLVREMRANRIRSSQELEAFTGQLVLAQIPQLKQKSSKDLIAYLARNPASAASEAVRNLRTSLLLSAAELPPKVIAVTSSVSGEGKTTTSVALAQNLTHMGKRVLLIEGDVRMRSLNHYAADVPDERKTISAALTSQAMLAEVTLKLPNIGDVILGAKSQINAADLFSSPRFAELIAEARAQYDIVLIDTPPVLVVPDSKIIAQQTDGVVFVTRWDSTTREQVAESLSQLKNVRVNLLGLVLTQVDPAGLKRYGYDAYGAYYGNRYYTQEG
ncbi:polysaccharide biosynthesis tyrosine autokinase [Paracoccus benzoatiresistens]|uniref:non-specific protein-tyrosine kinase n=1 Tax=Paracoccus benzoatiresistens TaxID=2997341 RepID=A0ABT4J9B5_9RHOB|nr:polysaccharide biosynthesis tyrosine autokinase [Paracoccus sp. EF6]MCZ0963677.1 polysaccharide biosynthesis tyrosine autokinase [Paracoccus sp. EF6]